MSNLSKGLCGKLARSVVWSSFALDKVIRPLNDWGLGGSY